MKFLTTATLNWFGDDCCDVKYLDEWNSRRVNYRPAQARDAAWYRDEYEVELGRDSGDRLFRIAADYLMRYQFYPDDVMSHYGDFDLWQRWLQVGDWIVQRIHVLTLFGVAILDVIGLTEVRSVTLEPRCYGFTYVTVEPHVAEGEWSATVDWRDTGEVVLNVRSVSRPVPQEPARNHAFIRRFQEEAHRRGIDYFKEVVLAEFGRAVPQVQGDTP